MKTKKKTINNKFKMNIEGIFCFEQPHFSCAHSDCALRESSIEI